jgi:hypothetical protein
LLGRRISKSTWNAEGYLMTCQSFVCFFWRKVSITLNISPWVNILSWIVWIVLSYSSSNLSKFTESFLWQREVKRILKIFNIYYLMNFLICSFCKCYNMGVFVTQAVVLREINPK